MNMVLVYVVLVSLLFHLAQGQVDCYICHDSNGFDGFSPSPCYNNFTGLAQPCSSPATCRLEFLSVDGVIRQIERACGNSGETVAHALQCTTILSTSSTFQFVDRTTCTFVCSADGCNNQLASNLTACASECSVNGFCNYFEGTCVCNDGFNGTDCSNAVPAKILSCIQCNDAVDPGCSATLNSTPCRDSFQNHCLASRTTLYDAHGGALRTSVSRGCSSSSFVTNDECTYVRSVDSFLRDFFEYTCTRTCTTNGCNTVTPQGTAPGPLYCCASRLCRDRERVRCPIDQGYCYSRVVYRSSAFHTDITYNEVQGYQSVSDERGCSAKPLTSQCTNTKYNDSNGVLTTCQETCQTHGCNDGWPNRPKCLQCTSSPSGIASESDDCLYNPQPASPCTRPYHQFCVYTDQGRSGMLTHRVADNRRGYPRSMSRRCSATPIGTRCADIQIGNTTYQQCNKTCSSDGCNHGMGGSSRPVTSLVVIFVTSVMSSTTQSIFSQ